MRADGDQAKTACGKLQLCAGLEAGIEGAKNAIGQRMIKRIRARRSEEVAEYGASVEEEESRGMADRLNILTIETSGTE